MFVLTLAKIYINLVSANLFVLNLGKKKGYVSGLCMTLYTVCVRIMTKRTEL